MVLSPFRGPQVWHQGLGRVGSSRVLSLTYRWPSSVSSYHFPSVHTCVQISPFLRTATIRLGHPNDCMRACVPAKLLQLCPTLWDSMNLGVCQTPLSMGLSSKNTGMGCHALLQGIFPGSNPHLLSLMHRRWILYHWATGGTPNDHILTQLFF